MEQMILNHNVTESFSTREPGDHFFGYYDKTPFSGDGKLLLSHRVNFKACRLPEKGDTADIVIWDIETGKSDKLATTCAFNWQQGSMLQWLGPDFNSRIIYNDYRNDQYVSVVLNVQTGKEMVLPIPVYSVSPDGAWAVCVNFERHYWCRRGYAYACGADEKWRSHLPDEDGVSLLNLKSGEHNLILRTRQMVEMNHLTSMDDVDNYLEHLMFSPDGSKFLFFHRWITRDGGIMTIPYVADRDGNGVHKLGDMGELSHYTWRDQGMALFFGSMSSGLNVLRKSKTFVRYVIKPIRPLFRRIVKERGVIEGKLFLPRCYFWQNTVTGERNALNRGKFNEDGHPCFRPPAYDSFVSDSYPDKRGYEHLYLCDSHHCLELGKFLSLQGYINTPWRCDLHPRWDRQGNRICVDSLHSGSRQMHVFDLKG